MKRILLPLFIALILIGCGGGGSKKPNAEAKYPSTQREFNIGSGVTTATIEKSSDSKITLNLDTYKDVYIAVISRFDNQYISVDDSVSSAYPQQSFRKTSVELNHPKVPNKIIKFRDETAHNLLKKGKNTKLQKQNRVTTLDDEYDFCIDMNSANSCTKTITLTAKKIVDSVNTKFGAKKLVIWIPQSEYDNGNITDNMLDEMADKFLKDGDANDIYDWDTNVHGKEWGSDASSTDSNVISATDTIDIALYPMNDERVAGYFWAKDIFKKSDVPASNEKLMLYINSKMYKKSPKEVFTTIAHEFSHLINFYQRDIKLGLNDSTWFKEFLAETTEDLLAQKLNYDSTRYSEYNEANYYSITRWYGNVQSYASVHTFGAFLLRNYGGAELLHKMSLNKNSDEQAIMDATGVSDFTKLLQNWSTAYILSNRDDLDSSLPKFNYTSAIHSHYGNVTYDLNPINFYSYDPAPTSYISGTLDKDSILYYKVGENLDGTVKINVKIEKGADIQIITQ